MKYCPCKRCDFTGWWDDKHSVTRPKFCPKCGVKLLPTGETQEMVAKSVADLALGRMDQWLCDDPDCPACAAAREDAWAWAERRAEEKGGGEGGTSK